MGKQLHSLTGPNIEKKGDWAAILTNLQAGRLQMCSLFDEIHRLQEPSKGAVLVQLKNFKARPHPGPRGLPGGGGRAPCGSIILPFHGLWGATNADWVVVESASKDRSGRRVRLGLLSCR